MLSPAEWVAQQIAAAPPLRPEQLDNLRALLAIDLDAVPDRRDGPAPVDEE